MTSRAKQKGFGDKCETFATQGKGLPSKGYGPITYICIATENVVISMQECTDCLVIYHGRE